MTSPSSAMRFCTLLTLAVPFRATAQSFEATNAAQVISKMKGDVIELAREIERIYVNRCNQSTLAACANSNYDPCRSRYYNATCPYGIEYTVPDCGNGITCSVLTDFANSYVWLPNNGEGGDPTDPLAIEGICVTAQLDEWFRQKYANDKPFWSGYGLDPPPYYFGGQAGYLRSFPAGSNECSDFDSRVRPWYTAATSGPKNIVLLLDTSASMGGNGKLELLKDSAKSFVGKLSVADRFVLVPFNDTASLLGSDNGYVNAASDSVKEQLSTLIDGLSVGGGMSLLNGFTKAFDVLETSMKAGQTVNCHSVIVLMSSGSAAASTTKSSGSNDLLRISPEGSPDPVLKQIACSTEYGVWNTITSAENISGSLQSYYTLFALGLGSNGNNNFAAWAEPYTYFDLNTVGTTVSAPVYDRTKVPHIFLGVAGIDFYLAALDIALGSQGNSSASVARIIAAATSVCPNLELAPCVVESLRREAVGEKAVCGNYNCTESVQILEEKCSNVTYPSNIWANLDFSNISFLDRACCAVGENRLSKSCPVTKVSTSSAMARWGPIGIALWFSLFVAVVFC